MAQVELSAKGQTAFLEEFKRQFEEDIESINEDIRRGHAEYVEIYQNRYHVLRDEKDALVEEKIDLAKSIFNQFSEVGYWNLI